jgi:large subunit ribosomal protein L23
MSESQRVLADVLIRPVVTEKSTQLMEQGKYIFEVLPTATKPLIRQAV